jgi:hypothetical protein
MVEDTNRQVLTNMQRSIWNGGLMMLFEEPPSRAYCTCNTLSLFILEQLSSISSRPKPNTLLEKENLSRCCFCFAMSNVGCAYLLTPTPYVPGRHEPVCVRISHYSYWYIIEAAGNRCQYVRYLP